MTTAPAPPDTDSTVPQQKDGTMTPTPTPGSLKTQSKSVKVADPSDIEPGLDLIVQRMPHLDRSQLAAVYTMPAMFPQQLTLKAVDPDGRLLGTGQWLRPTYFAEGWIAIRAVVRRGYEDHGVGSALRRAVLYWSRSGYAATARVR